MGNNEGDDGDTGISTISSSAFNWQHMDSNTLNDQVAKKRATFSIASRSFEDEDELPSTVNRYKRNKSSSAIGTPTGKSSGNGYYMRTVAFNRVPTGINISASYAPSLGGISRQSQSEYGSHSPRPSTALEKTKMTRRYLGSVTSIIYTIFLIVFGIIAFLFDAMTDQKLLPEAYMICLIFISFSYLIFLYIDIRIHLNKAKKLAKEREAHQELYEDYLEKLETEQGPMELQTDENGIAIAPGPIEIPVWTMPQTKPLLHKYCFKTGRHGEFLYLKLGAAWFCLGLLIHSCLIITYEVIFLTSVDPKMRHCGSKVKLAYNVLFALYSLFALFFIYKYINVIINYRRGLARFCFMHAIGTSLAFWINKIVWETKDSIVLKSDKNKEKNLFISLRNNTSYHNDCPGPEALNTIYKNFSPYLYPFIIEYCILLAGVWYMIWSHISTCPKKQIRKISSTQTLPRNRSNASLDSIPASAAEQTRNSSEYGEVYDSTVDHDTYVKINLEIHADCHASNRGLFSGLILVVFTVCFIILFFVATSERDYFPVGRILDGVFELVVLCLMTIAAVFAYVQTSKLDINTHPISNLDDILLFIAVPAFFASTILTMIPAIENNSPLIIAISLAQMIQVIVQTPFIIDGMRRCSNAKTLRKKKPGRELVTFLTIANVSLWIYYTFSVKTADTGDERYTFYGYTEWGILSHLSQPLIMFYRFHSSVCLVDIWKHSYEKAEH